MNPQEHPYGQSAMLALHYARSVAYAVKDPYIRTDHLLAGLIRTRSSTTTLIRMRTPPGAIRPLMGDLGRYAPSDRELDEHAVAAAELHPTPALLRVQKKYAHVMAAVASREEIDTDCLLGGILLNEESLGCQILHRAGANLRKYFAALEV